MIHINTILHCTDFSENAQQAWYVAQCLARDHGAKLVAVHVSRPNGRSQAAKNAEPVEPRNLARTRLESMAVQAGQIPVEVDVVTGEPGVEIVDAAKKWNADLIVMGKHGQTGLDRMIIGSVAEFVVRNAPCAVITLKPGTGWALSQEQQPDKMPSEVHII